MANRAALLWCECTSLNDSKSLAPRGLQGTRRRGLRFASLLARQWRISCGPSPGSETCSSATRYVASGCVARPRMHCSGRSNTFGAPWACCPQLAGGDAALNHRHLRPAVGSFELGFGFEPERGAVAPVVRPPPASSSTGAAASRSPRIHGMPSQSRSRQGSALARLGFVRGAGTLRRARLQANC